MSILSAARYYKESIPVSTVNNRRHQRLKHQAQIQVRSESELHSFQMRDFSESGLFLLCTDTSIVTLQTQVKVQTMEFEDAPILDAKVVRIEEGVGFAVEFN